THRVPGQMQPLRDRLDRHSLRQIQPTDLRPVLHRDHPPHPASRERRGQYSPVRRGSVFTRRRHGRSLMPPASAEPVISSVSVTPRLRSMAVWTAFALLMVWVGVSLHRFATPSNPRSAPSPLPRVGRAVLMKVDMPRVS